MPADDEEIEDAKDEAVAVITGCNGRVQPPPFATEPGSFGRTGSFRRADRP